MAIPKKQRHVASLWLIGLGFMALVLLFVWLLRGKDVVLLDPKGLIATEQYRLMIVSTVIMIGFAVPILFCLYYFAWKYRESNGKPVRASGTSRRRSGALAIWALPTVVAIILASLMLPATQKLEPQQAIETAGGKTPLTIQVVALRWKWLFIYPGQDIATVNFVQMPVDTPVEFVLTADETPMSSFWIPHLGGMLYAMTEHVNRLNLLPDTIGDYGGSAAEINGAGFADMRFTARVSSQEDFDNWTYGIQHSFTTLDTLEYKKLLSPSKEHPVAYYASPDSHLYSDIISKYRGSHAASHSESDIHSGSEGH